MSMATDMSRGLGRRRVPGDDVDRTPAARPCRYALAVVNGSWPVNGHSVPAGLPASASLLLMPCGGQKLDREAAAEDLYTGPMWQTLRRYSAGQRLLILSAKHGFVEPRLRLAPYDQRLTFERALDMAARLDAEGLQQSICLGMPLVDVQIVGGAAYRHVMRAAVASLQAAGAVARDASVRETTGGIGEQRRQLREYLQALVPTEDHDGSRGGGDDASLR